MRCENSYYFQKPGKRYKICSKDSCGNPAVWESKNDVKCETHMENKALTIKFCDWGDCKAKSIRMGLCSEHYIEYREKQNK